MPNENRESIGPYWVVYEPKDYSGTSVDEIISIHTDQSTIRARPRQIVRKWTRFHVEPWMRSRGLVQGAMRAVA